MLPDVPGGMAGSAGSMSAIHFRMRHGLAYPVLVESVLLEVLVGRFGVEDDHGINCTTIVWL